MDFKYLIVFIIILITLSIIIFFICKTYFQNKKNIDDQNISPKDEINQISELKGAVSQLSSTIEERLGNFGSTIGNSLTQQTQNTQKSLMEMHERLAVIDRAQENINSLSNQVNDLQNILSNKQLRGAFGEVQLENIVKIGRAHVRTPVTS